MGRRVKITQYEQVVYETDKTNRLYKILLFKFPKRAGMIARRFEAYTGLPLEWTNITPSNLMMFKTRLLSDVCINSAATTCAWLASAIRVYCEDRGGSADTLCRHLNIKRERSIFAPVLPEEMEKLEEYYKSCDDIKKRVVAALAILEFYTGARNSDTDNLSMENVVEGTYIDKKTEETKTRLVVTYSSEKTNTKASIPAKPIVMEILQDESIAGLSVPNVRFNEIIKEIFKEIGLDREVFEHRAGEDRKGEKLYDAVTSHMFRRSFATALDKKGTNIEMISRMMGHSNTEQTRRYICGNNLVLDDSDLSFFD